MKRTNITPARAAAGAETVDPAALLSRSDDHFYEELSRTNNEMANLQRELALTNVELAAAQKELQALVASLEDRVAQRTKDLAAATLEAERANQVKSEFLSRVSHELRTPMNHVLGYAQLLKSDHLTDEQQDSVRKILAAGVRLMTLINRILQVSEAEAGSVDLLDLITAPTGSEARPSLP